MRSLFLFAALTSVVVFAKPPAKPAAPPPPEQAEAADDADEGADEPLPEGMTYGPTKVQLGANAELNVPADTIFADAKATKQLLEKGGNIANGREVGSLLSGSASTIFEFEDIGYVKDDDKDALDADKMLTALREGQEEANEELKRRGLPQLELTGWTVKPHYDEATHNLEWAPLVRNKDNGHETVNYNVKLLGRRGVMTVTLLVSPDKFDAAMPAFRESLTGFSFVKGEDYASWTKGDKVAEYGLAALVTGGVIAVAAKSGLLGKLIKPLLVALAAAGAWIKRLFSGGAKKNSIVDSDQQR